MLDAARAKVGKLAPLGTEFRYVFDLGDHWVHRCTVAPRKVDPLDELGVVPDRPLPSFGWGTIPDQYGREARPCSPSIPPVWKTSSATWCSA